MIEYLRDTIPFQVVCGIVAILVELILSARWSPFYFIVGIPIYQRILSVKPGIKRMPTAAEAEVGIEKTTRSSTRAISP